MFADPLTVKYAGSDKTHARIRISDGVGEWYWIDGSDANANQRIQVRQSRTKGRVRSEFRLVRNHTWENPISGVSTDNGLSVYLVMDGPANASFDDNAKADMVSSLSTFLTASSNAAAIKLAQGEY